MVHMVANKQSSEQCGVFAYRMRQAPCLLSSGDIYYFLSFDFFFESVVKQGYSSVISG